MNAVFLRALDSADKQALLRAGATDAAGGGPASRFELDPARFAALPRSPFVYWASTELLRRFSEVPSMQSGSRVARQGLATADDSRFVRAWWEVADDKEGLSWRLFVKGGGGAAFYADVGLVVNWSGEGAEIRSNLNERGDVRSNVWMLRDTILDCFFRPGVTWPRRPFRRGAFVCMAKGCVFSDSGPTLFSTSDELLPLSAVLNSSAYLGLLNLLMARGTGDSGQTLKYEVGYVLAVPVPQLATQDLVALAVLARRGWSLRRGLDVVVEVSHAFVVPALLMVDGGSLGERAEAWAGRVAGVEGECAGVQAEIDERCFELYGIGEEDQRAITEGFGSVAGSGSDEPVGGEEDEDSDGVVADPVGLAGELVSWCVGVALGRFDVRLATGERELPGEPEPFDPLPVCSAGMLTGEDGLPLVAAPEGYPVVFPEDGVLVDDPGHPRDLGAAVRSVFEVVFGEGADALWQEAAALLDPKRQDVRGWLASVFFDQHLKRYSKSRRKAPIVWQIATPSRRYSVWLYAHRLTEDSLFRLHGDVVAPKLADEERRLTSLVQAAGATPTGSQSKEIAAHESFVEELRVMLEELRRVAPLWAPSLDDGVLLVMAPLWRLVPQHKAWQKELKGKWDELAAGRYDWAQIAMRLWPERVVPKCATDRSLAIAHDLEDEFWVEDADGKWQPRATPTTPLDTLITTRTSTTITTTLTQLVDTADA